MRTFKIFQLWSNGNGHFSGQKLRSKDLRVNSLQFPSINMHHQVGFRKFHRELPAIQPCFPCGSTLSHSPGKDLEGALAEAEPGNWQRGLADHL